MMSIVQELLRKKGKQLKYQTVYPYFQLIIIEKEYVIYYTPYNILLFSREFSRISPNGERNFFAVQIGVQIFFCFPIYFFHPMRVFLFLSVTSLEE